ncbi:MAG: hypothetical protein H0V17_04930 [Deltaproteobacteria bacterium]|nr:hypothetical protein [Deltaproteobacteria bacterium]
MAIRCANCRAHFSNDEITRGRPPMHPWPLTPAGQKAVQDNQQRGGSHYACPGCGNHSLEG